ncbi:MAG: hypothetical protein AB7F94_12940 [Nitrospira sp.]
MATTVSKKSWAVQLQLALCRAAGASRRSASASTLGSGVSPEPEYQNVPVSAEGLRHCARGALYQIHDNLRATRVVVEEHVDGTMRLTHHGRALGFHAIAVRPVPVAKATPLPRAYSPGHAETDPSVAHTVAVGTKKTCGSGQDITPDSSTLGETRHF